MDTRPVKPEDNKGGTFTQQLDVAEVTTAYISPVPAEAPGVITAEPGTVREEAIWFRTRDAGAGTIGGLIRDYTNLNGGVGQEHANGIDWEIFQSARYITNIIDIILEGFFYEQAVVARTGATTFTVVGNKAIFYTGGRLLRYNEDNAEILSVVSSSYDGGSGLTTVTVDGTLPNPLTDIEIGIQPKTAGYLALGATIVDTNGNEVIKIPATTSAVNELTVENAATGNAPVVSATGGDTDIGMKLKPKGAGAITVLDGNGNEVIIAGPAVASAVNELTVKNAATNTPPQINATGGDSNVGIAINPKGTGVILAKTTVQLTAFGPTTDAATGDGKAGMRIPKELAGMNIVAVAACVTTAGTTGTEDIQLRRVRSGTPVDVLSTKITIDSTEVDSSTAATAAVINTSNDDMLEGDQLYVDIDAKHTTAAKGTMVHITFANP